MYKNMGEIVLDLEKYHKYGVSGCCSVSNFLGLCKNFARAMLEEDKEKAIAELSSMTHLYRYATNVKYSKEILLVANPSFEAIKCDFHIAKAEIEEYFCKNFVTGNFEITADVLNKHWDMVDWDAYHNKTNRNFIDACKKANQIVGYKKDDEISANYAEASEKERWNFEEIFYSSYNGGRVRASFKSIEDCLRWSYHCEANLEDDGLYWGEEPAY